MKYADAIQSLIEHRKRIEAIRDEMRAVLDSVEPEPVHDYEFLRQSGTVRLSELFGDHQELFVVHNMGSSCAFCTLWADGFNGIYSHLANRVAFVVSSPDSPEAQQAFARERGWQFPMVSHHGTRFASDLGYAFEDGILLPGISVFRREPDRLLRVADVELAPYDDFCALWHLFDLLPGGPGGWQPRLRYS